MSTETAFRPPNPEVWLKPQEWQSASMGSVAVVSAGITLELQQAAVEFERRVDPDGTLPDLILELDSDHLTSGGWLGYTMYNPEGNWLGHCNLSFSSDNMAHFAEIAIGEHLDSRQALYDETFKHRGYGLATYKRVVSKALQERYGFRSYDEGLSQDGYKAWKRLEALGVARCSNVPKFYENRGRFYYTNAQFRILSPKELLSSQ